MNYKLISNDTLTLLIKRKGILTWFHLLDYIKHLPYGRLKNRKDLSLIITQQKGTCSSKHALLKTVSTLNNITDVKLILCMYKMNSKNTPKIGNVLSDQHLDYIPEAHCYLKINGDARDFTSVNSDLTMLKGDILLEEEIQPHQITTYKVDFHKNYIKNWLLQHNIPHPIEDVWRLREQCIKNLSL